MAEKTSSSRRKDKSVEYPVLLTSPRELYVITTAQAGLRSTPSNLESISGADVSTLDLLLKEAGAAMIPVFGPEERVSRWAGAAAATELEAAPSLETFYYIDAPENQLDSLAEKLLNEALVQSAYIKPPMSPPTIIDQAFAPPITAEAPPVTSDFTSHQSYLDAAPGGVDARYAWTRPGGKGQGIRIIDIEGAWRFTHEDLLQNQGGVIGGAQSSDIGWRNHGTAVVGEFGADENTFGVIGISPLANVRAISIFGTGQSSAKAITDAANALSPGDVILIELHAPGPRFNFTSPQGQRGFIAVEFWPADFAAIVYATTVRGVIVVEAGGNGSEDLDDPIYNTRPAGFPTSWKNPFNLANPQSGAIVVGAGAPPPNTHGRNHGADRSRLGFSNWGSRVDVQGWGREVSTTGYGDLQGGSNEDLWYTDVFSGTSSASPIVVGCVACMQGALKAANKTLLTPATARNILRTTGSPQQDEPGRPATQRIGNRPDLKQAFMTLGVSGKSLVKDSKDSKDRMKDSKELVKEIKDRKDQIKDLKEKEIKEKEFKEIKEKEFKEKDLKEIKDIRERIKVVEIGPTTPAATEDINERLAQLEGAVVELAHFIAPELRPDLQSSALSAEADLQALSQELEKQAVDAKAAKDNKDSEKLRES